METAENNYTRKNSVRTTIGLVLAVMGISAIGLIKVVLNQSNNILSIGVSVASIVLMLNITRYFNRLFVADIKWVSAFYALTLLYALFSDRGFSDAHGMLYQLFYFFQIIVLWNARSIDKRKFIQYVFYLLFLANLLGLYLVYSNSIITGSLVFATLGNNSIITRTTVGNLACLLLSACVVFRPRRSIEKCFYCLAWFLAVANLVLASRRTEIVAAILILAIYLLKCRPKKMELFMGVLIVSGVVLIAAVLYRYSDAIKMVVDHSTKMMVNGINTYIGRDRTDMGARFRREVLETKPYEFIAYSSISELLIGRGFMKGWFDVPYLQAFWDMGLLGGLLFLYIQLVLPIKYVIRKSEDAAVIFAQCCVINRLVSNIASGVCYGACFYLVMLMRLFAQDQETDMDNERMVQLKLI